MPNITPWLLFQSAVDVGGGFGAPWTNVNGALAIGGQEASSGPIGFISADGSNTTLLRVAQPNLAGQIPLEFRLLGVEVEVRGRWEGGSDGTRLANVQAVVGSSVRKSLGSCALPISALPSACFKGAPTDTMNFSEADVANPGFGFQLQGTSTTFNSQGNTLFIDSLRVRFHWGEPITPFRLRTRRRAVFTREALA